MSKPFILKSILIRNIHIHIYIYIINRLEDKTIRQGTVCQITRLILSQILSSVLLLRLRVEKQEAV